jgi:hypothetical protein
MLTCLISTTKKVTRVEDLMDNNKNEKSESGERTREERTVLSMG